MNIAAEYGDEQIRTLDWKEHIRCRPGMYIGAPGDGTSADDGIYCLVREVLDYSIGRCKTGSGSGIDLTIGGDGQVAVCDDGCGILPGGLLDVAQGMHAGAEDGSMPFGKSAGLKGLGIRGVCALSSEFAIRTVCDGKMRTVRFRAGEKQSDTSGGEAGDRSGTGVSFRADPCIFGTYRYHTDYVEAMARECAWLNAGLTIRVNGRAFVSQGGLLDLLQENLGEKPIYAPIHLKGTGIELAVTHGEGVGETYYSFVNGHRTTWGGTHLTAFREAIVGAVREFYRKDFDAADVCMSIVAAVGIRVDERMIESRTKFDSKNMGIGGPSVRDFVVDFLKTGFGGYLSGHPGTAGMLLGKIRANEKRRKAVSDV